MKERYDRLIIGAGIYGLYAAIQLAKKGYLVIVIEKDASPFLRGSYINQARVHNGYHYPRSYSTAAKSAKYFQRFITDYSDCVLFDFDQIYAVSSSFSWTNGAQFARFCRNMGIRCDEMADKGKYFNLHAVERSFHTTEYSFDAKLIGKKMYAEAIALGVDFLFGVQPTSFCVEGNQYRVALSTEDVLVIPWILNATYAGINAIHRLAGLEPLNIKYELCEVILVHVSDTIKHVGLTVMDGPFFSVMPFGKSGYHSLTTVSRTPHVTSKDTLPTFSCQEHNRNCSPENMQNCNFCKFRPASAFVEMKQTAKKYLNPDIEIDYVESLFTLKPILKASEIDDSRPTLVRQYHCAPDFYSVFSGKINTVYDLDEVLQ